MLTFNSPLELKAQPPVQNPAAGSTERFSVAVCSLSSSSDYLAHLHLRACAPAVSCPRLSIGYTSTEATGKRKLIRLHNEPQEQTHILSEKAMLLSFAK